MYPITDTTKYKVGNDDNSSTSMRGVCNVLSKSSSLPLLQKIVQPFEQTQGRYIKTITNKVPKSAKKGGRRRAMSGGVLYVPLYQIYQSLPPPNQPKPQPSRQGPRDTIPTPRDVLHHRSVQSTSTKNAFGSTPSNATNKTVSAAAVATLRHSTTSSKKVSVASQTIKSLALPDHLPKVVGHGGGGVPSFDTIVGDGCRCVPDDRIPGTIRSLAEGGWSRWWWWWWCPVPRLVRRRRLPLRPERSNLMHYPIVCRRCLVTVVVVVVCPRIVPFPTTKSTTTVTAATTVAAAAIIRHVQKRSFLLIIRNPVSSNLNVTTELITNSVNKIAISIDGS